MAVDTLWGEAVWGASYWGNTVGWANTLYPLRRAINFEPFEFLPGSETALAVSFNHDEMVSKGGFSGMKVFYVSKSVIRSRPFDIFSPLFDNNETSLIFQPVEPILESSEGEYYLYYGYTKGVYSSLITDNYWNPLTTQITDIPGGVNSRLSLSRPTVDWKDGDSLTAGAKASFNFTGDKISVGFKKGPDRGVASVQVDDQELVLIDTYNPIDAIVYETIQSFSSLAEHRVLLTVTGAKAPQSSGFGIGIKDIKYVQMLIGELQEEEYRSEIRESYIVGA